MSKRSFRSGSTLAICFGVALIEGFDLQSMGIAAPRFAPEFHLSHLAMGYVLAASPSGLFFGALLGGALADLCGRKAALILATTTFGIFQWVTVWAPGEQMLITFRVLCGLGLGGALPNLIALVSEAAEDDRRIISVVITAAGMPSGGAVASLEGLVFGGAIDWHMLFITGGIASLLLVPLMVCALPESARYQQAKAAGLTNRWARASWRELFADGALRSTLSLWVSFFFTAVVLYLLLNWLPALMMAKGFTRSDAFIIQLAFNVGAALGSISIGRLMQRWHSGTLLLACYVGLAAALFLLAASGNDLFYVAVIGAAVGALLLGVQFVLYALAPEFYSTAVRGIGTGAAVSTGRIGAAAGPYLAGALLGSGVGASGVLRALLPAIGLATVAVVLLMAYERPRRLIER